MDEKRLSGPSANDLRVIGIGASAGGIRALTTFFQSEPPTERVAYVVVLHLAPDRESHLASVLERATSMPVQQIEHGMRIEPGHVYVIAPNQTLTVGGNELHVAPARNEHEHRAPVDAFFRSLAEAYGPNAIGVVLSGTGPNGSSGIRRIRETGGLVLAQDPEDAEFGDMPRNAIATGMVDAVLPAAELGAKIAAYQPSDNLDPDAEHLDRSEEESRATRDILTQLHVRTGHDFSDYKPATIGRRIGRRITVHGLSGAVAYAAFLREHPEEMRLLLSELLISVTSFFRDPVPFEALERKVVPHLFEGRRMQDHVRVWVAGCATGEEAYSVAMLLAEHAAVLSQPPIIQVFATDLDQRAIASARDGVYTAADMADVPADRVRRFFVQAGETYTVRREIRELVLFAVHDVLKDPPFSHLDLITCRNLMIYLNRTGQQRLLEILHFALGGRGFLFLGSSESPEGSGDLFTTVDKANGIHECRLITPRLPLPTRAQPRSVVIPTIKTPPERLSVIDRAGFPELHLRLLEELGPPSIVVNDEHSIVHLSSKAGRYLYVGGGEPSRNVLSLIRPELRMDLRTALLQAARDRLAVVVPDVHVQIEDRLERVSMTVRPALSESDPSTRGFLLILFERSTDAEVKEPEVAVVQPPVRHLEAEVTRLQDQLQGTVGQYETQTEELRASNEELQAVNEELRSAVEELETSKEELQSVNEELITVNQELKSKIDELSETNNDFQNLINSTDIGTIFLDRLLRVKLFTPRARDVFSLISADIGRRLLDISNQLDLPGLRADLEQVLVKLQPREREVHDRQGHWYLMRILPYRTSDDRIDGVVMIFFDIHTRREAELRLAESQERLQMIFDNAVDFAIFTMTPDNLVDTWNSGAQRIFGFGEQEIVGRPASLLFTPEDRAARVPEDEIDRAIADGRAVDERWHLRKDGSRVYCSGVMIPLKKIGGFAKIAQDRTAEQDAKNDLIRIHEQLEKRVEERTAALAAEVGVRRQAEKRANDLVRQMLTIQEDERRRIARDVHDDVGQQFTALRMQLEEHRRHCGPQTDGIDAIIKRAATIDSAIEFLAWQLRPTVLDDLGLVAALQTLTSDWSAHTGVAATFDHTSFPEGARLDPNVETHVYRIAQEALNNVAKHARASSVGVLLGTRDKQVFLVVEDDGTGFEVEQEHRSGMGLTSIAERARLGGGAAQIESKPGRGTTILISLPIVAAAG